MLMRSMGEVEGTSRAATVVAGLLCAVAVLLLAVTAPARAAVTFTVSNTNDSGAGSLRQAITNANNNGAGEDTITFAPGIGSMGGEGIQLQSPLPDLSSVSIEGPGAERLTLTPGRRDDKTFYQFRIFTVGAGATVSIEGLTMAGGNEPTGNGGAVFNPAAGTLKITNSTVSGNLLDGGNGGGVYNEGTLTVEDSAVCNNRVVNGASGGGIYNAGGGTLAITDSTVCDNTVSHSGGGVYNEGTLTVEGSTFSGNQTDDPSLPNAGGAIFSSGTLTVTNTTLSGNTVLTDGVGGIIRNEGEALVEGATITGNRPTRGGGISNGGTLALGNSIVARNNHMEEQKPVEGPFETLSANLIGDDGVDPKLGPLQDNGGPTKTHLPLAGSPAIDQGNSKVSASTDQRGVERPQDDPLVANPRGSDGADIGAVELKVPRASVNDVTVTEGTGGTTSATFTVRLSESEVSDRTLRVDYATSDDEATAPADYAAASGALDFNSRGWAISKTVTATVQGDSADEPTEGFFMELTSGNPEYVFDGSALGIIRDDDEPPANGAPTASNDSYSTAQDKPLRVSAPGLLANDSDPDGDALTAAEVTDPAHGEVFVRADGSFAYFPDEGYAGADSFTYKAKDGSSASGPATVTISVGDATAPMVKGTTPANAATGVAPGANVTATFSEAMNADTLRDPTSLRSAVFKLERKNPDGTTTAVLAKVSYAATTTSTGAKVYKATLNPDANLQLRKTYVATVTTGAEDVAGNALDQDPTVAGNQPKIWSFKVRR